MRIPINSGTKITDTHTDSQKSLVCWNCFRTGVNKWEKSILYLTLKWSCLWPHTGLTKLLTLIQKDTKKHAHKYDCGLNKITQHNFNESCKKIIKNLISHVLTLFKWISLFSQCSRLLNAIRHWNRSARVSWTTSWNIYFFRHDSKFISHNSGKKKQNFFQIFFSKLWNKLAIVRYKVRTGR